MDRKKITQIKEQFDLVIHSDNEADVEYWYARELMVLLGYERWENFDKAILRAMDSCETSGIEVLDHFREVAKMMRAFFVRLRKWKEIANNNQNINKGEKI